MLIPVQILVRDTRRHQNVGLLVVSNSHLTQIGCLVLWGFIEAPIVVGLPNIQGARRSHPGHHPLPLTVNRKPDN